MRSLSFHWEMIVFQLFTRLHILFALFLAMLSIGAFFVISTLRPYEHGWAWLAQIGGVMVLYVPLAMLVSGISEAHRMRNDFSRLVKNIREDADKLNQAILEMHRTFLPGPRAHQLAREASDSIGRARLVADDAEAMLLAKYAYREAVVHQRHELWAAESKLGDFVSKLKAPLET